MRKMVLGIIVSLVFITTSPVVAIEESPVQWPSFDVVEWIFGLLEIFQLESVSTEMGPELEPNGQPAAEMGPGYEPNGEPTAEMGPGYEPNGEPTAEMGPSAEPNG